MRVIRYSAIAAKAIEGITPAHAGNTFPQGQSHGS